MPAGVPKNVMYCKTLAVYGFVRFRESGMKKVIWLVITQMGSTKPVLFYT